MNLPRAITTVIPKALLLAGISTTAIAQQNLFNVPSSDITEKGEWFFQEQLNLSYSGVSNTTVDYGLGNQFEVGLNLFAMDLYHREGELLNPEPMVNLQKRFNLTESWGVGIGTQLGALAPVHFGREEFSTFNYVNNQFNIPHVGKLIAGGYFANSAYSGGKDQFNFMAGLEIPIWHDRIHFQADYIQSDAPMGVGVVGWVIFLPKRWNISIGAQIPAAGSHNDYGLVLEFTRL
mgnify:CR=1 FL=1